MVSLLCHSPPSSRGTGCGPWGPTTVPKLESSSDRVCSAEVASALPALGPALYLITSAVGSPGLRVRACALLTGSVRGTQQKRHGKQASVSHAERVISAHFCTAFLQHISKYSKGGQIESGSSINKAKGAKNLFPFPGHFWFPLPTGNVSSHLVSPPLSYSSLSYVLR